jgi:hypothetical protein
VAPRHVVYEDEYGGEVVYRQPRDPAEVHLREYGFWLDHHRAALPGETLPDLP